MPNAALVVETALLLLAAFLIGCVLGYLGRRLTIRAPAAVAPPSPAPTAVAPVTQLVVAPTIAPLPSQPPRPSAAQRLAAAAGRQTETQTPPPEAEEVPPPQEPEAAVAATDEPVPVALEPTAPIIERPKMEPARVAGETTSGRQVADPHRQAEAPPVMPEAPEVPVTAAEVPPIDEVAHVVAAPSAPAPAAAPEPDAETAARQAVEGGWTPPRRTTAAPVPLPEAEIAAEADAAMAAARTAVASASAAAAAVLADRQEPVPEARPPAAPKSHGGFGKPEALAAPRGGQQDDLTSIKGLTPAIASSLNGLGIFHFDQISAWDQKAVVWVETHLSLRGRVGREKWIEQARALAGRRVHSVRPQRR